MFKDLRDKMIKFRKQRKIKDVTTLSKNLKWKWAGHVYRIKEDRWTTRSTEWTPRFRTRTRKQGRKKTSWRGEIDNFDKNCIKRCKDKKHGVI